MRNALLRLFVLCVAGSWAGSWGGYEAHAQAPQYHQYQGQPPYNQSQPQYNQGQPQYHPGAPGAQPGTVYPGAPPYAGTPPYAQPRGPIGPGIGPADVRPVAAP